ncbi:excalibur calcium-binding domain-containing protein [Cupriavidus sp. GA3-3]|jgi:hypothetical protein
MESALPALQFFRNDLIAVNSAVKMDGDGDGIPCETPPRANG